MIRSKLVDTLNELPDIEVGTVDGEVIEAKLSEYEEESGIKTPYIELDIEV
jgi:hypothetical protein